MKRSARYVYDTRSAFKAMPFCDPALPSRVLADLSHLLVLISITGYYTDGSQSEASDLVRCRLR